MMKRMFSFTKRGFKNERVYFLMKFELTLQKLIGSVILLLATLPILIPLWLDSFWRYPSGTSTFFMLIIANAIYSLIVLVCISIRGTRGLISLLSMTLAVPLYIYTSMQVATEVGLLVGIGAGVYSYVIGVTVGAIYAALLAWLFITISMGVWPSPEWRGIKEKLAGENIAPEKLGLTSFKLDRWLYNVWKGYLK